MGVVLICNYVFDSLDTDKGKLDEKEMIFGIVTRIDVLNFITLSQQEAAQNGHN